MSWPGLRASFRSPLVAAVDCRWRFGPSRTWPSARPAQTLPTPASAMRPAPSVAGDAGSGLAAQDMGQNDGRAARVVYMPVVEYGPGAAFPGVIGRTAA